MNNVLCTPCKKKGYRMHSSDAISFSNCALDSLAFLRRGPNPNMFVFKGALFELWTTANDGKFPGELDRRAEMSVRVRKGGFMVNTLGH